MIKTQDILGLPIISISDGEEVGKVKSIIINADKGSIDYVFVETGTQNLNAQVIPAEKILGIGEYALTIENENSIDDISEIQTAIDLFQKNVLIKGTKVLTRKGRLIGEIGDFFVDEDRCCVITGLEFIGGTTQKSVRILPRENVITFGKNLIVVTEDVEDALLDSPEQLGSGSLTVEIEKKNSKDLGVDNYSSKLEDTADSEAVIANVDEILQKASEEMGDTISISQAEMETDTNGAAGLFEQKQRQYLIGRRSTKTIVNNSGEVIISEGMVITDEIIDSAKQSGKLIELVMNNKA